MKIDYVGRNFHIDDSLREHTGRKLQKLVKFLEEPVEIRITLDQEKKHRSLAELHVSHRLGVLQATEETDGSMQDAVNLALEKVESQAVKSRQKRVEKRQRAARDRGDGLHRWPVEVLERDSVREGETPRIIESSHLSIKPMTIDEAALALEGSSQELIVFRDATTGRLSVLHKRKDGNYGLIAPEL